MGSLPDRSTCSAGGLLGAVTSPPAWSPPPAMCAFLLMLFHDASLAALPGLGVNAQPGCSRLTVALGSTAGTG